MVRAPRVRELAVGHLILASASPQRRAILEQAGIPFEVRVSGVEEETEGDPAWVAEENARRKALAVAAGAGDTLVLGADTDVALDGDILGKPQDEQAAGRFLARLSGRTHEVVGGIALARGGELLGTAVERTAVTFRSLDRATLDWYVRSREWEGRAGGYAIQGRGAVLITEIRGDYLNVVGLPLARLLELRPELLPTA
jgi:septum formation protein